jgi:hypothetical protein
VSTTQQRNQRHTAAGIGAAIAAALAVLVSHALADTPPGPTWHAICLNAQTHARVPDSKCPSLVGSYPPNDHRPTWWYTTDTLPPIGTTPTAGTPQAPRTGRITQENP